MAVSSYIKNVVVVGATGNLGTVIVQSLVEANKFIITAASRNPSKAEFPNSTSLTIKTGDYTSPSFLAEIFGNQDAVVFTLHYTAVPELEVKMIEAAAAAGVQWILPVEFGGDNGNPRLEKAVPVYAAKRAPRERIEELAEKYDGLKWIGIVTNPWFDFSMKISGFQIDVKNRTALVLDGGTAKFNTTNLATVGLAVARLLSLPITSSSSTSLSDFGNKFGYISSFLTSQREILDVVQKLTKTSDADWSITNINGQAWIDDGPAKIARGDRTGMFNIAYGNTMTEGLGGDYEAAKGVSNSVLGLPEESLENTLEEVISQL
ncbi:NAD(P)-binding protein [Stipitochalara longipes BDJ]|nr:NAD(P)-binding protein [Stipitochalara longipes BDJ]